ncbi:nuclear transport factor 2 family protein [Streptomyces sp. Act143]|uniref:nuclear transport factor 2 family protein n=1 Tax=Streptomyces sp. Act143 TaxID=2200760 RepID=UPI0015E81FCF|nr:nuclear transport factor 2 family protein [Streptomyces sp. Act143]
MFQPPASEQADPVVGRDVVAGWLTNGHAGRFVRVESVRRTVHRVIADGDTAAVLQGMRAQTHDGRDYVNEYVFVYRVRDGYIDRIHSHADTLTAARVGILPFEAPRPRQAERFDRDLPQVPGGR